MKNSSLIRYTLILLLILILLFFMQKIDDDDLFNELYEKGDII